ncbi:MAG: xanthine dehydrogenase molybdopterin binding subunit [Myxococcales bacterium]|jgi:xanthine dehydrogenase large subunit|nr:xanthine dehydrogenase molybdopterin binding subunit [Myxococcales bacterium]
MATTHDKAKDQKDQKVQRDQLETKAALGLVGTSPQHLSGREHVMGRSQFVDDMPKPKNMLAISLLTSPVARGHINLLDLSEALALPGVVAIITAKDIPGENQIGAIFPDETLLADGEVEFVGEPIAIVAAQTKAIADAARQKIKLEITAEKPVLTIDEALAKEQFVGPIRKIEQGDVDSALAKAPHVLSGVVKNAGQEHFYMETQRALAVPEDNGAITLYSSTQHPTEVHRMSARVLGLPQHAITIDVKRLGGGFGGKESQATAWACIAALTAHLTGCPAEIKLNREEDMAWTGKRHAFESPFKVGFDEKGRILALEIDLRSNCGAVADVSTSILERGMLHTDNAYRIDHIRVFGRPCRTNLPPATAFRGFGAPQGILVIETIIERIADHLDLDPFTVRQHNLYAPGDHAPYGELIYGAEHLAPLLAELRARSRWDERRAEVLRFNAANRYLKKGLAMVPVKFGISFTAANLNQGVALVHVYPDGSVSVSHGAIEMGQEVNTKIAQIAATNLGLPLQAIRIETNNTKRVGNAPPTAASSGCDLNGHAVNLATIALRDRLLAFAEKTYETKVVIEGGMIFALKASGKIDHDKPLGPFRDLALKAFVARIDLAEHGHYVTPKVFFDRETGKGHPFLYYVFGAAITEVTLDLLTGRTKLDAVHVLHDSGESLNPIVDIGQIHGGFVQGQGWATTEELVYSEQGRLISDSPATYKVPTYGDVPAEFDVKLYEGSSNDVGVHRSKANGEPPFVYGEAVFFAIANAVKAATGKYPEALTLPATPEKVLKALETR